jgi:hypothetical protein
MSNMSNYWIIGGEYTDTNFSKMVEETRQVHGPFNRYEDALSLWHRLADKTRSICNARFVITREGKA